MQCERARELLSPYLDAELDRSELNAVAAHLDGCRSCSAIAEDYRRLDRHLSGTGRAQVPETLGRRLRAELAQAAASEAASPPPPALRRPLVRSGTLSHAAAALGAAMLSALATWWLIGGPGHGADIEHEIVAAHIRSLLQESPIQVATSDPHAVKPWFTGRIDFAPEVKDLTSDGFPLLGARLDYVHDRRVGALVYKRRLHVINVFMWPSATAEDAAPRLVASNGYNLLLWSRNGMIRCAVSDLNAAELSELQRLL